MFNHENPLSLYAYIVWSSKQQHFFETVFLFIVHEFLVTFDYICVAFLHKTINVL